MNENFKPFIEQLFSINPIASSMYGSGQRVGSRNIAWGGVNNSGMDLIIKLKKEAKAMIDLLNARSNDEVEIRAKAANIEGFLLTLQVLGQITDQVCDSVIIELHRIVEY
jgi:hypothetical protein